MFAGKISVERCGNRNRYCRYIVGEKMFKNKNIKDIYSLVWGFAITGVILFMLGAGLLIYGFFATGRRLNNPMDYGDIEKLKGNHAMIVTHFDVTGKPVEVGKRQKEHYYLLSDGNRYVLSGMTKEQHEEIVAELEKNGSYTLHGVTFYIGDKEREEIVGRLTSLLGTKITTDNMDEYVGDVQIRLTKITYFRVLKEDYIANLILGGILVLIGLPMCLGYVSTVLDSRKVSSVKGDITAGMIDAASLEKGAVWYDLTRVYLTGEYVIGIIVENGKSYHSQVVLRYKEISSLYGVNQKKDPLSSNKLAQGGYKIFAETTDGKSYVLSDAVLTAYDRSSPVDQFNRIFQKCQEKNPSIRFGSGKIKYQTWHFPFTVLSTEEGEEKELKGADASRVLSAEDREEIERDFERENLARLLPAFDAIVKMSLKFEDDGTVTVTVGCLPDREEEVFPGMEEFLTGQLSDGWGEGYEWGDYIISFCS